MCITLKSQFSLSSAHFHTSAQLSLLSFIGNEANFLPLGSSTLGATGFLYSFENAVRVWRQITFHKKQPRWQNEWMEIDYQCRIKCNAWSLDEICMTNWLWRTQSKQVLWTPAQKPHWNSFHYERCAAEQQRMRGTDEEKWVEWFLITQAEKYYCKKKCAQKTWNKAKPPEDWSFPFILFYLQIYRLLQCHWIG